MRSAIRKASGNRSAQLPAVAVENGWKCDKDDDKVRVLPDGTRWLTNLLEQVIDLKCLGMEHLICTCLWFEEAAGLNWHSVFSPGLSSFLDSFLPR